MNYTDTEITLCRRLHELGVRPEIREGDWIIDNGQGPELVGDDAPLYQRTTRGRSRHVLLWSWSRCREWLRERGYPFVELAGPTWVNNKMRLRSTGNDGGSSKDAEGQTDLECALAVMIAVVEEKP